MHRFRKRSDAKQRAPYSHSQSNAEHVDSSTSFSLPELPPASTFRTSLILPQLTRRFSVLRSSTGDPVSIDILRERLAAQRVNGAPHQITEEEEEAIITELARLRQDTADKDTTPEHYPPVADFRTSTMSNATSTSDSLQSTSSSPSGRTSTGRPSKRYSNNLFGSSRFNDQTYMRSVISSNSGGRRNVGGSGRSAISLTPTESSTFSSLRPNNDSVYSDTSLRPVTPEETHSQRSPPASPREVPQSAPAATAYFDSPISAAEYRLSKTLGPSNLRRASLALEEAIKEIEEEAEDEILVPRSATRSSGQHPSQQQRQEHPQFDMGTAISSDRQMYVDAESQRASPVPYGRPGTTSPTERLPGYIPGMPRPMTPRDHSESEDLRAHSTTPRAASPFLPHHNGNGSPHHIHSSSSSSSILRRESNASRHSPRPSSPHASSPRFDHRYTPDEQDGSSSPFFTRRRPASPLSGPTYQPMSVPSRPGTPSNVVWNNTPASSSSGHNTSGHNNTYGSHSRNGSWVSNASAGVDAHAHGQSANLERAKSTTRSLRSPALPDSPTFDHSPTQAFIWNSVPGPEALSRAEQQQQQQQQLGSPILIAPAPNRGLNSSTPTQSAPQSPDEAHRIYGDPPSVSKRSSRQTTPSTPFTLGSSPPLVLSSMANSSRSSLESTGSSYHSWDGGRKDLTFDSHNGESPAHPWYASSTDKSSMGTPAEEWDTEDVIARYAGLTKADFAAIQEKLVGAAEEKAAMPESRDRAPSSLRRRRPSTSQSNYSLNGRDVRVASPPPQATSSPRSATFEQAVKASALLDAMVENIPPPRARAPVEPTPVVAPPVQTADTEETSRRNRDLAQAIFGGDRSQLPPQTPEMSTQPMASHSPDTLSPTSTPALSRNPSSPGEKEDLARDVQRRADAATMALRKSPSHSKFVDVSDRTLSKKRINLHQISSPQLVSASTSVDTIPLQAPQTPSSSKIGLRIRKLRGTLRTKPIAATGDEITPYPFSLNSPPPNSPPHGQTAHYNRSNLHPMGAGAASATELGGFKVPIVPSPPASAGPGLKGFMARFRKTRAADTSPEYDRRDPPLPSPRYPSVSAPPQQDSFFQQQQQQPPQPTSPLPLREVFSVRPPPLQSLPSTTSTFSGAFSQRTGDAATPTLPTEAEDAVAIKQLYDAASNLGLDRSAINELLVRSTSTSSRSTGWTVLSRNDSAMGISSRLDDAERARSPAASNRRPSVGPPDDQTVTRKLNPPRHTGRTDDNMAVNSILRRTIIFPSDGKSMGELQSLMRRPSTKNRQRSGSVASLQSSKSIHDRAPTPPPPRSPNVPRFSTESSPPLPNIPRSFISAGSLAPPPALGSNQNSASGSTYDSLYDMYEDTKPAEAPPPAEVGAAVEVIEMADGQTIWSIVNGLRDDADDVESLYNNRASFASEYSTQEGVQVFFKEHGRSGSKGSNTSFISRKKTPLSVKTRPQTKVFYTDSSKISRLIENLARDQDAGKFNFMPTPSPTGHTSFHSQATAVSGVSEHHHWTVEERLEHMLGSMGPTTPS